MTWSLCGSRAGWVAPQAGPPAPRPPILGGRPDLKPGATPAWGRRVRRWDWGRPAGSLAPPGREEFRVTVDGAPPDIARVGFRRRVLYAPLRKRDLRAVSFLYLQLSRPVPEGAAVEVANPSGRL